MYIVLNGKQYRLFATNKSQSSLGLIFNNEYDVMELYSALTPNSVPTIIIYHDDGTIFESYANNRVIGFNMSEDQITITLQVDPLEVSAADRLQNAIDVQNENIEVSDAAIAELAEYIASLEERIAALEDALEEGEG